MTNGSAERIGAATSGHVRVTPKGGSVEATVEVADSLRDRHVCPPNGLGVEFPDAVEGPRLLLRSGAGYPPS